MPSSSRKKKAKAADFSKAKLKLGKGKRPADNVIDTSFKARSIVLPSQSIAVEKDESTPLTRRKLSFDDLLAHFKHYSAGTRKDAIYSMRELLNTHPHIITSSLSTLLASCVRLIGDEDAHVRKALLSFFAWFLPLLPLEDLRPHMPMLLLFTTSAQTHIFPEIRVDAVRFLDIFLEVAPDCVVDGWWGDGHGKRVIDGYLGLLSAGTKYGGAEGPAQATSTASVVLSVQSKLVVLKSFANFLRVAIDSQQRTGTSSSTPSFPTWYMRRSFNSQQALDKFGELFHSQPPASIVMRWRESLDSDNCEEDFICTAEEFSGPSSGIWGLEDLVDPLTGLSEAPFMGTEETFAIVANLARSLHGTLLATFLDSAPTLFSPSVNPPEAEVQMVASIFSIMHTLFCALFQGQDLQDTDTYDGLRVLLGHITGYFPFTPAHREITIEQAFQGLNIAYCELTSLLVQTHARLHGNPASRPQSHVRNGAAGALATRKRSMMPLALDKKLSGQLQRVGSYVTKLLRGHSSFGANLPRPVSSAVYLSLLPTIWTLLDQPVEGQDVSALVLDAALDHALLTSSTFAVKKLTVELVGRVAMLDSEVDYQGHFSLRSSSPDSWDKVQEWVMNLPRVLWELGSNDSSSSEVIMRVLLCLLKRGTCPSGILEPQTLVSLCTRLVPFFTINHPTRGQIPGPFASLPALPPSSSHLTDARRLALDLAATAICAQSVPSPERCTDTLGWAVEEAVRGTKEQDYWEHVVDAMPMSRYYQNEVKSPL